MAKMTCKSVKAKKSSMGSSGTTRLKVGDAPPGGFELTDFQDGSFKIRGVTQAGNAVDLDAVATLTATSSDPAVLTVDTPAGMDVATHGVKKGTATVTVTATWNDATTGPFVLEIPCNVVDSPVSGLVAEFGPAVVRP